MEKNVVGIVFVPFGQVKAKKQDPCLPSNALFIDVSSYGSEGWNVLSPRYDHGGIPVPGMPGKVSRTLEGIWQGLKRFPDAPEDLAMFETGRPKKRRGKPLGHVYEDKVLAGVVEARERIFVPAYSWMLANLPSAKAKYEELLVLARTHMVYIYDRDANGEIKVDKPYAHAAFLADRVTAALAPAPVAP